MFRAVAGWREEWKEGEELRIRLVGVEYWSGGVAVYDVWSIEMAGRVRRMEVRERPGQGGEAV